MLMSIGYELRIDTIKNHTEIPNRLSLEDLFLKIYQSMMNVSSTYSRITKIQLMTISL